MPELPQIPLWVGLPLFLAILIVLVMIHELGHFVTAKLAGVKVEEFAFGFPPRLFSVRHGETDYSFNALPLGGYVKMLGEEDPGDPRSLAAQPAWVRIVIMAAGVVMNFVLAVVLFAAAAMIPVQQTVGRVTIQEVVPDSPAALAGLQPGDQILRVNGRFVETFGDVQTAIQLNLGSPTTFEVERTGALAIPGQRGAANRFEVVMTPRWAPPPGQGATGVRIALANPRVVETTLPIWEAVPRGFQTAFDTLLLTRNGLIQAFSQGAGQQAVTGPVGMYQLTEVVTQASVSSGSIAPLLTLMGFISMSLAIFNILPIPALDGGRILFVLVEILRRGKRIAPEREAVVHLVGFAMLIGLIVVISFADVARLVSGESLFR